MVSREVATSAGSHVDGVGDGLMDLTAASLGAAMLGEPLSDSE
jgi:hypothetical protein